MRRLQPLTLQFIVLLCAALSLATGCKSPTAPPPPDTRTCPTFTGANDQSAHGGAIVRTYAYFKDASVRGATYATFLVYDSQVVPPCLQF